MDNQLPAWRLTVSLRDGIMTQTATIDFARRYTCEAQLGQLKLRHGKDLGKRFVFSNESGDRLTFQAASYHSHGITRIGGVEA